MEIKVHTFYVWVVDLLCVTGSRNSGIWTHNLAINKSGILVCCSTIWATMLRCPSFLFFLFSAFLSLFVFSFLFAAFPFLFLLSLSNFCVYLLVLLFSAFIFLSVFCLFSLLSLCFFWFHLIFALLLSQLSWSTLSFFLLFHGHLFSFSLFLFFSFFIFCHFLCLVIKSSILMLFYYLAPLQNDTIL